MGLYPTLAMAAEISTGVALVKLLHEKGRAYRVQVTQQHFRRHPRPSWAHSPHNSNSSVDRKLSRHQRLESQSPLKALPRRAISS